MFNKKLVAEIAAMKGFDGIVMTTPEFIVTVEEGNTRSNAGLIRQGYTSYLRINKLSLFEDEDSFEDEQAYDAHQVPTEDYLSHMSIDEIKEIVSDELEIDESEIYVVYGAEIASAALSWAA